LCCVATWAHRKVDQKYLEVLKCGAGEEGEDHMDGTCKKRITKSQGEREHATYKKNEG